MKKMLVMLLLSMCVTGCNANETTPTESVEVVETETETVETPEISYCLYGRYYTDGYFVDSNGEEWGYETESICNYDGTPYNGIPVKATFYDNGTETIKDDIPLVLEYTE